MKESKKRKGTKVKLTKGKRVSLRCPLTIDNTKLEHNYDADCAQICLTVENVGGGGVTDDCVESAIVVIRLFDAKGNLVPCTKNEYFAKLLRFGDEGLPGGANITFRLTPDCEGSLRVEDVELYISRVRYADGSVTDYLRGDFFDMPDDPVPLHKKHKKNLEAITAKFGSSALYEPEELTEIIWRCTCGEFSEAEQCATCSASKAELFDFFKKPADKGAAVGAPVPDADPVTDQNSTSAPATDATTEYDAGILAASTASSTSDDSDMRIASDSGADSDESGNPAESDSHEFIAPPPPPKTDGLKIGLIIAIIASALLLLVIIGLLVFTIYMRGKQNAASTASDITTTLPTVTTTAPPAVTDSPLSDHELIVRSYLETNDYDNALGYARANECDSALINEILTTALHYYTQVMPDDEQAMKYAGELGDTDTINSIVLSHYNEAMQRKDYTSAIEYAEQLVKDKDAKLTEAAEGLLQSQLEVNDFNGALNTAEQYKTSTTVKEITLSAITYYTNRQAFDEAIELAQSISDDALVASIADAAATYHISQLNYDSAVKYVKLTGDSEDIVSLIPYFTQPALKKHLPLFFPYLTFAEKQAVHASVMSTAQSAGVIDVYGNAFWSIDQSHLAAETGKSVVSIECNKQTTILLFSDGTVAAYGDNTYGQCNTSAWSNIVAISASDSHTVGLKADGTVVATGRTTEKQCDVGQYSGAVAVAAGGYHTLILLSDGTVVATGMTTSGQCNTSEWKDIVMISAGFLHSVGLKSDGTVVAAGSSTTGRCDVGNWKKVIQISAGESATVALTEDGKVLLASGDSNSGDVSLMSNVIWVSAGSNSVTALLSNGTLMTTGTTPPDLSYVSGFEILTKIYGVQ